MTHTQPDSIAIITLGEALVEIMRPSIGQPLDTPGEFLGPYASGAPAIFAVAAARLGMDAGFIGVVGVDAFGRLIRRYFLKEGVDSTQLLALDGTSTGCAFVAYNADGEREFVFHIRHAAPGALTPAMVTKEYFSGVKWLHISGSSITLNQCCFDACQAAVEFTLSEGGRISFDPNLRAELMSLNEMRMVISPFLEVANLVLPTASEARAITGETDNHMAAQAMARKPEAIIVIKHGPKGCTIYQNGNQWDVPGFEVDEVDPTGAGDCFSAAFIAGLESGWPLDQVGRFANAAGALAVTKMGPMEGAPTKGQVERFYA